MNLTQLKDHFSGKKSDPTPAPIPIYSTSLIRGRGEIRYCSIGCSARSLGNIHYEFDDPEQGKDLTVVTQKFFVVGMPNTGTRTHPDFNLRVISPEQLDEWKGTPFEGDMALATNNATTCYISSIDWKYVAFTRSDASKCVAALRDHIKRAVGDYFKEAKAFAIAEPKRVAATATATLKRLAAAEKILAKF